MRRILSVFLIFFFVCVFFNQEAFCSQSIQTLQQQYDWIWNVPVVPPIGGWDSEPGRSISTALAWCEREISESSNGAGGHDIHFVRLTFPVSSDLNNSIFDFENAARTLDLKINSQTVAVMSFSSPEIDRILVNRMAGSVTPLLLAGGENVLIDRAGRPILNIFALDLFRDYRCEALALYAGKIFKTDARLAIAASRFTVNQEREAKIFYSLLDAMGFMPMPFWADASVQDTFAMMSEEIESYEGEKSGVMISFMGSMGAREIWRNFIRLRSSWRIWNCSAPDESYLSCHGMILADQNVLLEKIGGFIDVKRHLWMTRAMPISDNVAAGRVLALIEWLQKGLDTLPQPVNNLPGSALLRTLERVKDIRFGNQILSIAPNLHRPESRNVYIVEVKNREYENIETILTHGLVYVPSY